MPQINYGVIILVLVVLPLFSVTQAVSYQLNAAKAGYSTCSDPDPRSGYKSVSHFEV